MNRKNLIYRMLKWGLIGLLFSWVYMLVSYGYFSDTQETELEGFLAIRGLGVAFWAILYTYVWFALGCTIHRVRWFNAAWLALIGLHVAMMAYDSGVYLLDPITYDNFVPEYWDYVFYYYGWFGLLPYALAIVPPTIIFHWEILREHARYAQWFLEGIGGKVGFAGPATYNRLAEYFSNKYNIFAPDGITSSHVILGRADFDDDPRGKLIAVPHDSNIITIGQVGSGKSTTALWPNLLTYHASAIVLDMKGEHARQTYFRRSSKEHLRNLGLRGNATKHFSNGTSYLLDPFGENKKMARAALHQAILTEIDPNDLRGRELVEAVADGLVVPESKENRYFEDLARLLLKGLIAHVLTSYPKKYHTFPFIFDLMCGVAPGSSTVDFKAFDQLLLLMLRNDAMGGWPQQAAGQILRESSKTRGNIISNIYRSLEWAGDPAMRIHLSKSDFLLKDIAANPNKIDTLYIVLPEGMMEAQMRWLRVLTSVMIVHLRNRQKLPNLPTLMCLDEVARLGGQISAISKGYATLRSSKVKLWSVWQNYGQLKATEPKLHQNFIANSVVQMFGIGDLETAQLASDLLGRRTLARKKKGNVISEVSREVLTPSEIIAKYHKAAPRQLIFPTTGLPIRAIRYAYKRMKVDGFKFRHYGFFGFRGHYEQ